VVPQKSSLPKSFQNSVLHDTPRVYQGVVVAVSQQHNTHIVLVSNRLHLKCGSCNDSSGYIYGAKTSKLIPVGTPVYVLQTDHMAQDAGVIMGSIPKKYLNPNSGRPNTYTGADELVSGSPVGAGKDEISSKVLGASALIHGQNAGRPVDAYPGDFAQINEMGVGFWVGRLVASLKASQDCSVECHYLDSMVRIASHNMQLWTAASEKESIDDGGAFTEVEGLTPYVWESLGSPALGMPTHEDNDPATSDLKGRLEPIGGEAQSPFWRMLSFRGFLGDVSSQYTICPDLESDSVRESGEEPTQDEYGLCKQVFGTDGAYSLVSAKSISLVKDIMIPVPHKVSREAGDKDGPLSSENWPIPREDAEVEEDENEASASAARATITDDILAKQLNNDNVNSIHHYDGTWDLREVTDLKFGQVTGESSSPPEALVGQDRIWARLPKIANIRIDERKPQGRYFVSRSLFVMHEDGAIHIEDGYGAQISMRGGSIDISAPGSITLRPGKDLVTIAGEDINLVAGTNVEIAATAGDAKVEANRNVEIMGGNSGVGGLLLESKGTGVLIAEDSSVPDPIDPRQNRNEYTGILLKAMQSTVALKGRQTYIGADAGERVILDAGASGDVQVVGRSCNINTESTLISPLGSQAAKIRVAGPNIVLDSSQIIALGNMTLTGRGGLGGQSNLVVTGRGQFLGAVSGVGEFGEIPAGDASTSRSEINSAIELTMDSLEVILDSVREFLEVVSTSLFRDSDLLRNVTFSFLTSEARNLPIDSLVLPEASWQRRYRLNGVGAPMQSYPVNVGVESAPTQPWPGHEARDGESFGTHDSVHIDPSTGAYKDRNKGLSYDDAIPALVCGPFSGYTINKPNTPYKRG